MRPLLYLPAIDLRLITVQGGASRKFLEGTQMDVMATHHIMLWSVPPQELLWRSSF